MGVEIPAEAAGGTDVFHLASNLFARYRDQARLLSEHRYPADRRIQHYLDLLAAAGITDPVRLAAETLILDQYGLVRELTLPSDAVQLRKWAGVELPPRHGVLHNPVNDRRATQGFHVAEGRLPIPADKTGGERDAGAGSRDVESADWGLSSRRGAPAPSPPPPG